MSAHRQWHEVKKLAQAQRAALTESLVRAKIADVHATQIRIQAIDQFIAWFESDSPDDCLLGPESNHSGY